MRRPERIAHRRRAEGNRRVGGWKGPARNDAPGPAAFPDRIERTSIASEQRGPARAQVYAPRGSLPVHGSRGSLAPHSGGMLPRMNPAAPALISFEQNHLYQGGTDGALLQVMCSGLASGRRLRIPDRAGDLGSQGAQRGPGRIRLALGGRRRARSAAGLAWDWVGRRQRKEEEHRVSCCRRRSVLGSRENKIRPLFSAPRDRTKHVEYLTPAPKKAGTKKGRRPEDRRP